MQSILVKRTFVLVSIIVLAALSVFAQGKEPAAPIDREALVKRHTVRLDELSATELPQIGNGEIAFGIDATGLQTFHGNTMSHWGWQTVPCPVEGEHSAFKLAEYDFNNRKIGYRTKSQGQEKLFAWMRENPHRAALGRLRFLILRNDSKQIEPKDVKEINQTLDLWNGTIESRYAVEGTPVRVLTCVEPESGSLAVRVESPLISNGKMNVELAFPYGHHGTTGADWTKPALHQTLLAATPHRADFERKMDSLTYYAALAWNGNATLDETAPHTFVLRPDRKTDVLEFVAVYALNKPEKKLSNVDAALQASKTFWPTF